MSILPSFGSFSYSTSLKITVFFIPCRPTLVVEVLPEPFKLCLHRRFVLGRLELSLPVVDVEGAGGEQVKRVRLLLFWLLVLVIFSLSCRLGFFLWLGFSLGLSRLLLRLRLLLLWLFLFLFFLLLLFLLFFLLHFRDCVRHLEAYLAESRSSSIFSICLHARDFFEPSHQIGELFPLGLP